MMEGLFAGLFVTGLALSSIVTVALLVWLGIALFGGEDRPYDE